MIAYQPERSDQRVCLHVSDGGSVWNKVKRLLNGKYNTNTNTNGKYKYSALVTSPWLLTSILLVRVQTKLIEMPAETL